jgi:hypothetical protein
MAIVQTLVYTRRGSTRRFTNTVTDHDGALIDPDSHVIQFLQPDGTQEGTDYTTPTKVSLGVFYQDLEVPTDAPREQWTVKWIVTVGTQDWEEIYRFRVPYEPGELYCAVSDVARVIKTDLTINAVEDAIFDAGEEVDELSGDLTDRQKKRATMFLTASYLAMRVPDTYRAGNLQVQWKDRSAMFRAKALEEIQNARGIIIKSSSYQHIDEDLRYTQ